MLTQLTRFASATGIELRDASIDVRASFPAAEKYGVGAGGAAMDALAYTIDLATTASRQDVIELVRRARAACHTENSLRAAATAAIRVNGEEIAI